MTITENINKHMKYLLNKDFLIAAIEKLIYEGGKDNFIILESCLGLIPRCLHRMKRNCRLRDTPYACIGVVHLNEHYLVQLSTARGAHTVHCQTISNYYIEEKVFELTPEQEEQLKSLQWKSEHGENWYQLHTIDNEKRRLNLAQLILKTAAIYDPTIAYVDVILNLDEEEYIIQT